MAATFVVSQHLELTGDVKKNVPNVFPVLLGSSVLTVPETSGRRVGASFLELTGDAEADVTEGFPVLLGTSFVTVPATSGN